MVGTLHYLDYIAIAVYILLMAVMGIVYGRIVKDSGAYFKGNGSIPWGMATVTNFMGLFSTFVFVAYAGMAYEYGLVAIIVFWCTVPACISCGALFARRWKRTGKTTAVEYLETRYNMPVRQISSWVGLVMRFLDNIVRLYAIGVFICAIVPISFEWSVVIAGVIVTLFNLFGGIWSVSIMSTVQFIILVLVTVILLPLSFTEAGGFSGIASALPDHVKLLNGPKGAPFWLLVYYLVTTIKYNGNWSLIQKFYCVKDDKAAAKTGIFTGVLFFIFGPVFILPAVAAPVILPDIANPEMSYVALSSKLLPIGIMGILFSSMFAATMSSLNSEYNVMSSVITHDIYKRLINPSADDGRMLKVAKFSTMVIGLVMIGGAIAIQGIGGAFEANKLFGGIVAVPLAIPLFMGLVARRPDSRNAVLCIFVGIAIGIIINLIPAISWELGTGLEILVCFVLYFWPFTDNRPDSKQKELRHLFEQLSTTESLMSDSVAPEGASEYKKVTRYMFIISLAVAGILFCSMSVPSLSCTGGLMGCISGGLCLLASLIIWINKRK